MCAMVTATFSMFVEAAWAEPPITPETPLSNITFVAFDTETTGLAAEREHVVEIAATKFRASRGIARQCWLVNPGRPIPPFVQKIHGISDAMVSNSPPFVEVFPQFARFTEGCVLVAHNAKFDRRFVAAELRRNNLKAPSTPVIDSLPLFKTWFPAERSYALASLTTRLAPSMAEQPPLTEGERTNRFHTAGWDSDCLMALFLKGSTNLPAEATLADLLRLTGGAYSFGTATRYWRPAVQSSAGASPVSPPP
jgi:DNA polymerase III alpha subunit (gram-positive type)